MKDNNAEARHVRLVKLLADLSWKRGPVVLASGRTSDFYLDCKQTVLNAEGALLIGEMVYAHVAALRAKGQTVVGAGGLTLGADPIAQACAVVSQMAKNPVHAFIIRKEPKGHGTAAWLEGSKNLGDKAPVLIVEDVVTTGGSTLKAIERARESGLVPVGILALVDRQEGGAEALGKTGLPFTSLCTRADFNALASG